MNNKHTFKKTAALFLGLALSVGATGCSFITTDNQKDLEQPVATVNISGKLGEQYKDVASDVEAVVTKLSKDILKRDLISYYLSTGYTYVEQYGYSYEDTFNMLLDGLVSREILIQNAVAYYLKKYDDVTAKACEDFVKAKKNAETDAKRKALLEEHEEVLVLEYFLSINDDTAYDKAVYSLKKSLNDSLDSMEASYITAETEEEHNHEEARTLPTGVDTEKEDYYTTNYEIYTGRNGAGACGEYEPVEGSTVTTRQKAYNAFLTNLQAYNLINVDKKKGEVENTKDVTKLHYYYVELASILGQSLINQYFESLESDVSEKMDAAYLQERYTEMLAQQQHDYEKDDTAFASAMDSAAEGSYLLYGLDGYGYVYNILLPFSTSQNIQYSQAKNRGLTQDQLYQARNNIVKGVKATDLRDTWISEHDHANYSYKKDGKTYFFEDNLSDNSKYEQLDFYAGEYAYNEEGLADIDAFITEFETYVLAQANKGVEENKATIDSYTNEKFYETKSFKGEDGKVDYSKFTYHEGKVNFTDGVTAFNHFNRNTQQYRALSAVNEMLFAYGTDPGALNTYLGYAVSPYTTSFVKEFEWAAQQVVADGVGSYAVCVTDYGWHILYCSFAFDGGAVYGETIDWEKDMNTEGSFANLFYETIKEAAFNSHATEEQNRAIREFDVEECVIRYTKAYKDLLEMKK